MRLLAIILLFLSFNTKAETLYSSVDDYLKTVTTPSEEQANYIKEHPDYEYPNRAVSKNKKWYVGYEPIGTSDVAFLYMLEATVQGKLRLVAKVSTEDRVSFPLFENLAFYGNNTFTFSIQSVRKGNATHTYNFKRIKGNWILVSDDYSELAGCGEGENFEVNSSIETSTNYLTGQVKEQRYSEKDCKPLKPTKKKLKFTLVPLADFYPLMEVAPKK